jgi:hypothetical protein
LPKKRIGDLSIIFLKQKTYGKNKNQTINRFGAQQGVSEGWLKRLPEVGLTKEFVSTKFVSATEDP